MSELDDATLLRPHTAASSGAYAEEYASSKGCRTALDLCRSSSTTPSVQAGLHKEGLKMFQRPPRVGMSAKHHNLRPLHPHAKDSKNQPRPVVRSTATAENKEEILALPHDSDDELNPPTDEHELSDLESPPVATKGRNLSATCSKDHGGAKPTRLANERASYVKEEDHPFEQFKATRVGTVYRRRTRNIHASAVELAAESGTEQERTEDGKPAFKMRDTSGTLAKCECPRSRRIIS